MIRARQRSVAEKAIAFAAGVALAFALLPARGAPARLLDRGTLGPADDGALVAARGAAQGGQGHSLALAVEPPGTTERASIASNGTEGDDASGGVSDILSDPSPDQAISADGRWVVFVSRASTFADKVGDTPVFVHDRQTGQTTAIPWANGELFPALVWVGEVSISAHGETVAFTVMSVPIGFQYDTLVNIDPNPQAVVAVWRRSDNKTVLLTKGQLAIRARQPSVSGDGRFVAYTAIPEPTPTPTPTPTPAPTPTPTPSDTTPPTLSWNQPAPTEECPTGTVHYWVNASDASGVKSVVLYYWPPGGSSWIGQAMVQSPGTAIWSTVLSYPSTGSSTWAGHNFYYYVGATDTYGNYSKLPASGYTTVKVFDYCIGLAPPTIVLASARQQPTPVSSAKAAPSLPTQVAVFDLQTGNTTTVSHDANGSLGTLSSSKPSISADGRYVAFQSDAALAAGDGNGVGDIYRWDAVADAAIRISRAVNGGDGNAPSYTPSISADGNRVAFASVATNLTGDPGVAGISQVFLWEPVSPGMRVVSRGPSNPGSGSSYSPSISADGRIVAFDSEAADLVAGDTNGKSDVFLRNVNREVTIRASVGNDVAQGSGDSQRPSVSGEGRAVAFDSSSTSLVPGDTNGYLDVFVRDLPPAIQLNPPQLQFGVIGLGTSSPPQFVVGTSTGWTPVDVQDTSIGGANPDEFGAADACSGRRLDIGQSCAINVDFVPREEGPRTAILQVVDTAGDSPQHVDLVGGVSLLTLTLDPPLGPPGLVTMATGSGFPPGAVVDLRWSRGLTASPSTVFVGRDGTFSVGVLIFHNDAVGPRTLVAAPASGTPAFPPASADFLVVQGPLQPPAVGVIRYQAPEIELIVIRR
jgi:Tol biopolymer transport system component